MNENRRRLFDLADQLVLRNLPGTTAREAIGGACEALYRGSTSDDLLAEFKAWLETRWSRSRALASWLALVRLSLKAPGDTAEDELAFLDAGLGQGPGRAELVLRTEAARQLWRIEGDAGRAWERLRDQPAPGPQFKEAASEAAVVWLRLAAMAADWRSHDRLACELQALWDDGSEAACWIEITIAEHEIQRGFFAAALGRLKALQDHADKWVQMAALGVTLRILLDCDSDAASDRVKADLKSTAGMLEPLLEIEPSVEGFPTPDEREERRRISHLLLNHISVIGSSDKGNPLTRALALEREGEKPRALALIKEALEGLGGWELPEESMRLRLMFVRLTLELTRDLTPAQMASFEGLVGSVIIEAEARGLLLLEMLACDQRALVRAHLFEGRWDEAVADAGRAANLAARLLEANRDTFLERSLRASLLPVFDRAVELLAVGSLRVATLEPKNQTVRERFGRAILDYVEQSMELALAEARALIGAEADTQRFPGGASSEPVAPKRCETLQASLPAKAGVLQYFLVGRFLLVFAYGRKFFVWHAEALPEGSPAADIPIRTFLQSLLGGKRTVSENQPISDNRDLVVKRIENFAAQSEQEMARLAAHLLPTSVMKALKRHTIRRLAIVPHDVLYRAPFGRLSWRGVGLARHFGLSIHPTGDAAGLRSVIPARRKGPRGAVGFFIGPRLEFAQEEQRELRAALGRVFRVETMDTEDETALFAVKASEFDVLYLACHGSKLGENPQDAFLRIGKEGIRLSEISSLNLKRCRLAVLQACWTGWMEHVREFPVQGFPQAILDGGAAAVVAPMLQVPDSFCPIFTAVFCRVLLFLPGAEALGYTLDVLRQYGERLTARDPQASRLWGRGLSFDSYEYRFAGDPSIDLTGGWLHRILSRFAFHIWLWRRLRAKARP